MFRNSEDISDNAEWQLREELTEEKPFQIGDCRFQIADWNRAASAEYSRFRNLKSPI